jgi:hypothetical protein
MHLVAIGIVTVQAWLGVICPLTSLEMFLRDKAGDPTYDGTFVAHWLRKFLYYEAPWWVFVIWVSPWISISSFVRRSFQLP